MNNAFNEHKDRGTTGARHITAASHFSVTSLCSEGGRLTGWPSWGCCLPLLDQVSGLAQVQKHCSVKRSDNERNCHTNDPLPDALEDLLLRHQLDRLRDFLPLTDKNGDLTRDLRHWERRQSGRGAPGCEKGVPWFCARTRRTEQADAAMSRHSGTSSTANLLSSVLALSVVAPFVGPPGIGEVSWLCLVCRSQQQG